MATATLIYFALKAFLLLVIARTYAINDAMQKQWLFLSLLYVSMVAALSWVFILQMHPGIPDQAWHLWLLKTLLLVIAYFKLLSYFEDGLMFWVIFLGGWLALIWF